MTPRSPRVALLGPYASANLGDTAIQMAVIQNLRELAPGLDVVGICPDPHDTLRSLAIASFPLSGLGPASGRLSDAEPPLGLARPRRFDAVRGLRRSSAFAKTLDLLLISGGGQLDDFWGGAWGHPWAMWRWTALARRHRVPVAFVGIGLDRLASRWGRRLALSALRLASYRSFRDAATLRALQDMGLRQPSRTCPDLAFGLRPGGGEGHAEMPARQRFAVINPISRKTWSHARDDRHDAYLRHLGAAGVWLAARGIAVRIACSQPRMDADDAAGLARMLADRGVEGVEIAAVATVDDYLAQVRGAEVVVAARLHGAVLGLLAGAPVVALAPLPKVRQLMADAGLAHLCLPLQECDAQGLIERIARALDDAGALRIRIETMNAGRRSGVSATCADALALISERGRGASTPPRTDDRD